MFRVGIFFVVSVAIVALSGRSLRHRRSHGFHRFFAFELMAALILLNAPVWFADPLAPRQLLSWMLGITSIALAMEGFRLLHILGRPSPAAGTNTDLGFEKTTTLVSVGAYRLIRHPLYTSLLALTWCAFLKDPSAPYSIAIAVGATGFLTSTALCEERENLVHFGQSYAEYRKRTWRFVPFVF